MGTTSRPWRRENRDQSTKNNAVASIIFVYLQIRKILSFLLIELHSLPLNQCIVFIAEFIWDIFIKSKNLYYREIKFGLDEKKQYTILNVQLV